MWSSILVFDRTLPGVQHHVHDLRRAQTELQMNASLGLYQLDTGCTAEKPHISWHGRTNTNYMIIATVTKLLHHQLRSCQDHSSPCSFALIADSPYFGLSGLEEADLWVWGLQYLSAGANWRSLLSCEPFACVSYGCIFKSLLTSALASPVIWYQNPADCRSIRCSLQSLQWGTRRQDWEEEKGETSVRLCGGILVSRYLFCPLSAPTLWSQPVGGEQLSQERLPEAGPQSPSLPEATKHEHKHLFLASLWHIGDISLI